MKFCPRCLFNKKLSSVTDFLSCSKCGAVFSNDGALISEDVVRIFIRENKPKFDRWLKKLK
jgi:DNA-directed RNA polymerase subunit M/transcription elongation factor TFIIS